MFSLLTSASSRGNLELTAAMKNPLTIILAGAVAGAVAAFAVLNFYTPSEDKIIKDYYAAEVAVNVSPHHIRKAMDKGDDSFVLVDLRSQEEYEREHVTGAINVPAYKDPYTSAYGDVERITRAFRALPKDKDIIVYCYSMPCMTGRKIGNMLAQNDIYVQELGIGWNEWRHFWTLWNHEHEWSQRLVEDYVISGPEPGTPKVREDTEACPIGGEFGC
ncbi:hypothetical protein CMO96_04835 [Candidatus Woesebacteria bacterium]|nr:hypothetical protein [Candidatus Woesebacteria bacterium]